MAVPSDALIEQWKREAAEKRLISQCPGCKSKLTITLDIKEMTEGTSLHKGRPDWDEYFIQIAKVIRIRSDCTRRKVGAVIVKDNRIVATGYNGAPSGKPGCESCPRAKSSVAPGSSYDTGPGSCVAIHAEANALLYADYDRCKGATIYISEPPCDGCRKLIAGAGISFMIYKNGLSVDEERVSANN